jgi:hypothetical protein
MPVVHGRVFNSTLRRRLLSDLRRRQHQDCRFNPVWKMHFD